MSLDIEITPDEALRRFHAQQFSPCYLIYGDEPFFVDQVLRGLLEKGVAEAWRDWNYDRLDGHQASAEEVVSMAKRGLMGGDRRIVVVQNADRIADPKGYLAAYAAAPSPKTVVAFIMPKPDKKKPPKLFEALKSHATQVSCRPLYENEVARFIRHEADRQALHLTKETIEYLKEALGRDPSLIRHELEKIALMDTRRERREGEGEQSPTPPRVYSVFEFIAAVERRDIEKGLRLISALLAEGEPPLMILAMLARHFRMMATAKEKSTPGPTAQKLPAIRSETFLQALRSWSSREIRLAFDLFRNADDLLKGGGGERTPASIVLERLVMDLCHLPPAKEGIYRAAHLCRSV